MPVSFLTRLRPASFGALPRGPLPFRQQTRLRGIAVDVASTRPDSRGVSTYLAADRYGRWIAYAHDRRTSSRRLTGASRGALYLAIDFGLA